MKRNERRRVHSIDIEILYAFNRWHIINVRYIEQKALQRLPKSAGNISIWMLSLKDLSVSIEIEIVIESFDKSVKSF